MARYWIVAAAMGLALGMLTAVPADAWNRGQVGVLAALPPVTPGHPSISCIRLSDWLHREAHGASDQGRRSGRSTPRSP
jgi:hypothetical protein